METETGPTAISPTDPLMILAGIKQFGLAGDGADLRDLEAAIVALQSRATPTRIAAGQPERAERLRRAQEAFYEAVTVDSPGVIRQLDDGVRAYVSALADRAGVAKLKDPSNGECHPGVDAQRNETVDALLAAAAEKAGLEAELEAMRRQVERLSAIAEDQIGETRLLKAGPDGNGGFSFDLTGGPVQFIAEYLAQLLGKGEEAGPANYAEIEVHHHEMGPMTLTIQRRRGKTPHQLRLEAESHAQDLEARMNAASPFMTGIPEQWSHEAVEAACKAYWPLHWPKHFSPGDASSIRDHMLRAVTAAFNRVRSLSGS